MRSLPAQPLCDSRTLWWFLFLSLDLYLLLLLLTSQPQILSDFTQTKPLFPCPRRFFLFCPSCTIFFFISKPSHLNLLERSDLFYPASSHPVNFCRVCSSPTGASWNRRRPRLSSTQLELVGALHPKLFHFQLLPRHPLDGGWVSRSALLLLNSLVVIKPNSLIVIKPKVCCRKEAKRCQVLSRAVTAVCSQLVGLSLLITSFD